MNCNNPAQADGYRPSSLGFVLGFLMKIRLKHAHFQARERENRFHFDNGTIHLALF